MFREERADLAGIPAVKTFNSKNWLASIRLCLRHGVLDWRSCGCIFAGLKGFPAQPRKDQPK